MLRIPQTAGLGGGDLSLDSYPHSLRSHRGVLRHGPWLARRRALLPPAGRHAVLQAALRHTRCRRVSAGREWRGGAEALCGSSRSRSADTRNDREKAPRG